MEMEIQKNEVKGWQDPALSSFQGAVAVAVANLMPLETFCT